MKIHRILQVSREEKVDGCKRKTRTHQVVLAYTSRGEYVTWDWYNDTKYSGGHYHTDVMDAFEDFKKRIEGTFGTSCGDVFVCTRQIGQAEIIWEEEEEEKIYYKSVCPKCKSTRTGTCEQGTEPHRYCCGKEVRTITSHNVP